MLKISGTIRPNPTCLHYLQTDNFILSVSTTPTKDLCINFSPTPPTLYNLVDQQRHTIRCSLFLSFSIPRFRQFYNDCLFTKLTNKMQLCRIIYCSLTALQVSSDTFAHHQEHLNCIYSFWYYSFMSLPTDIKDE